MSCRKGKMGHQFVPDLRNENQSGDQQRQCDVISK